MYVLLNKISIKIANTLDKNNQCTELERQQMYFGLQNLIYNIVITVLILILACIMDTLMETSLLFTFFGILRIIAGGYHFDSVSKCIISTALIMVGGGKCAQNIEISLPICILACIIMNIVFFSYIPKGSHKNPFSNKYAILQQKRLKAFSCILTLIALLSTSTFRTVSVLSMFITVVLLLPAWYHKFPAAE